MGLSFTKDSNMPIRFTALATADVAAAREGRPDANGQSPEVHVAQQGALPCRHCLDMIGQSERFLVLAWRPFPTVQPYAEVGPIFLHADDCARGGETAEVPAFLKSPRYIVRGYGSDDRIVYGTGSIVETAAIPEHAIGLLADPRVAYAHVRSASNNCYHCRIERA
jgi:hypothetical protein